MGGPRREFFRLFMHGAKETFLIGKEYSKFFNQNVGALTGTLKFICIFIMHNYWKEIFLVWEVHWDL